MSSRAPGRAASSALRTRCTRRSLLVTVPSDSHQPAAAGSTTSASSAVRGEEDVLHDQVVERLQQVAWCGAGSASDWAGFSPIDVQRASARRRSMASNISVRCQPRRGGER